MPNRPTYGYWYFKSRVYSPQIELFFRQFLFSEKLIHFEFGNLCMRSQVQVQCTATRGLSRDVNWRLKSALARHVATSIVRTFQNNEVGGFHIDKES